MAGIVIAKEAGTMTAIIDEDPAWKNLPYLTDGKRTVFPPNKENQPVIETLPMDYFTLPLSDENIDAFKRVLEAFKANFPK